MSDEDSRYALPQEDDSFAYTQYAYEAPVNAQHRANQLDLAGDYHVRLLNGKPVYIPGSTLSEFEDALGEKPKTNLESSKFAEYDAGEKVMVDGERGVILELHTREFTLGGQTFGGTQDEPLYVIGTESGSLVVDESEINTEAWESETEADPQELQDAEPAENYTNVENPNTDNPYPDYEPDLVLSNAIQGRIEPQDPGIGFDSWPDSWNESETPNRIILLDAWVSMGASWDGCFRELNSKRLCSAMKDEVYMTTEWR